MMINHIHSWVLSWCMSKNGSC